VAAPHLIMLFELQQYQILLSKTKRGFPRNIWVVVLYNVYSCQHFTHTHNKYTSEAT